MLSRIIHRIFAGRHYWRGASFDEVAELYVSRLIMVFAINIVNLFAAVYLYKLGYSVSFIATFYASLYGMKVLLAVFAAKVAAYFGPKHGILFANLLRIPSLIAFALVPVAGQHAIWAIIAFGVFQQLASLLYDICYMIDFSKVKHVAHAGKEIGTMQIIEKTAKVLSPLIGGVLASLFSPEVTIILAGILFVIAAVPLFRTVEPTMTRSRLRLAGFPWRLSAASLVSQSVVGFDFVASGLTWTLFVAIFVFTDAGESVYAALGGLASLGVLISMLAAWMYGQLVDRHQGGLLLIMGTVANSVIHLFRPVVYSAAGVMGINIANETATSAYALPLTRLTFDVADSSGFRITYFMFVEMIVNIGASLACVILAVVTALWGVRTGMTTVFLAAACVEFLLLVSRRAAR